MNLIENDRELSTIDISEEMKTRGVSLSSTTIRRRLTEAGFKFSSPTSKPSLTKLHQTERFRFAKQNKNRNWNKILFTDETTFYLKPRMKKIWKRRRERILFRKKKIFSKN